jgi:exopolyphosphatase/pppGpp-phosphohydrolase
MIGLVKDGFVIVDQIAEHMTQEKVMGVDGGTRNGVRYGHIFSSM